MPNYLPLLLLGGGAVFVATQGKKKGGKTFGLLEAGPGCKSVRLAGLDLYESTVEIQEGNEEARQQMIDDAKRFWEEDLFPLIDEIRPSEDLRTGAQELIRASVPSCFVPLPVLRKRIKKAIEKAGGDVKRLEKTVRPDFARVFVLIMFELGYYTKLVLDGVKDLEGLPEVASGIMEDLGIPFGEPADIGPGQMATTRPNWIVEAALQMVG